MKYEAPIFERTNIESNDIVTASPIVVEENDNGGANYKISFSNLFKK